MEGLEDDVDPAEWSDPEDGDDEVNALLDEMEEGGFVGDRAQRYAAGLLEMEDDPEWAGEAMAYEYAERLGLPVDEWEKEGFWL